MERMIRTTATTETGTAIAMASEEVELEGFVTLSQDGSSPKRRLKLGSRSVLLLISLSLYFNIVCLLYQGISKLWYFGNDNSSFDYHQKKKQHAHTPRYWW